MKVRAWLLFCLVAAAAPSAFARYDGEECWNPRANHFEAVRPGERQDDLDFRVCRPRYTGQGRPDWVAQERECWNPRAGHFERVRAGERQNDLDYRHCRPVSYSSKYGGGGYGGDRYRDNRPRECWNPRARHYERVRPGERQDDLDFNRCRAVGGGGSYGGGYQNQREQECWNPRAGHYEGVRPGERQDDLDFSRCRPKRY